MTVTSLPDAGPDGLDEVLAQLLRETESGRPPDVSDWCRRFPHWAGAVRAFCADLDRFGRLLGSGQSDHNAQTTPFAGAGREGSRPAAHAGRQLGGYELLRELGRGGMGVVYLARPAGTEREVALKVLNPDHLGGSEGLRQLRDEFNSVCRLKHPNIVPVYHYGEDEGRPFYTMELIEGSSLADEITRWHADPRAGVAILEKVARAVHHAHQRQVVHRDLKPGNILLDAHGEPRVTDFGLAVRLRGERAEEVLPGGSLPWMAPEAVRRDRELTTAVDVWALGVILYELMAGRRPFTGSANQVREQIESASPPPPRVSGRRPDRDLEAICAKCMKQDPAQRYGSAEALADDLLRWRQGRFPRARKRVGAAERVARGCRLYPLSVAGSLAAVLLLVTVTVLALDALRAQEQRTVEEVTEGNRFLAGHVANTILAQLQTMADALVETAEDPELHRLHDNKDTESLRRFLKESLQRHNQRLHSRLAAGGEGGPLVTMVLLNPQGRYIAATHDNRELSKECWVGRDYFHQALKRASASGRARVHVSHIFQSGGDGLFKLALSIPVRSRNNPKAPLGVLIATIATGPTFGLTPLSGAGRTVILVGPQDTRKADEPPAAEPPPERKYLILLHPAYDDPEKEPLPLDAWRLPAQLLRRLDEPRPADDELDLPAIATAGHSDDHYLDPMAHRAHRREEYKGRWLAGFSQVGNTELVVGVQQHYDQSVAPPTAFLRRVLAWGGAALAALLGMIGAVWLVRRWRAARR